MPNGKISCSSCQWTSEKTGLDAEHEFTEHVVSEHMDTGEPDFDSEDSMKNLNVCVPTNPSHPYAIYLKGSLARTLGSPDLLDDCNKDFFDQEKAIDFAIRIAIREKIERIYITKGHYPSRLVRIIEMKDVEFNESESVDNSLSETNIVITAPSERGGKYNLAIGSKLSSDNPLVKELEDKFKKGVYNKDESVLLATRIGFRVGAEKIFLETNDGLLAETFDI